MFGSDALRQPQADQLVHQTEQLISESGEQMTDDEKKSVEEAVAALKEVLGNEESETEEIRSKMDELVQASQAMATRLYQQAAEAQAAEQAGAGDGADFEAGGGVLASILPYLREEEAAWIRQHGSAARLSYLPYDWSLNELRSSPR